MAHRVFNALQSVTTTVLISANRSLSDYQKLAPGHVYCDPPELQGQGPLVGLLTGMKQAARLGAKAILVSPCDTPDLSPDLLFELVNAWRQAPEKPVIAQCGDRVHPLHGVYPVTLVPLLQRQLAAANRRVMAAVADAGAITLPFGAVACKTLRNRNRWEDLQD